MNSKLTQLFLTQQYAKEIENALTSKEIDNYIGFGVNLLMDAQQVLESGEYIGIGMSREDIELDIERIEYNLDEFTEAFMNKENAMVITKYERVMFYHMN
jgi:hypothetical protein